ILKKYLMTEYEVITDDFTQELEKIDLIIADEEGFNENKEDILKSKNSNDYLYLPLLLITRMSKEDIPDKYLDLIDEIIEIPIQQNILISRIKNLLSIRTLFLSTQVFQKLIEHNPAGVCILLEDKKIKYANKIFLDIIEKKRKNILNKNIIEVFPDQKLKEYFNKGKKEKNNYTLKMNIKDNIKWLEIQSIETSYKNIKLISLILIDITERIKQEKEIEYLSYKDKLTDLYNRRFFEEEMERLDTNRQLPLSIIMADVNGLKIINDSYGHEVGDELLKKAADLLKKEVRDEDIVARQGGDEFAILLPKTKNEFAREIVNRIKANINENKNQKVPISVALGIATKENPEEDIKEVLKQADDNMYQNKLTESRKSKSNIVQGLLNTLSEKSNETSEHTIRMTKLAFNFGEKLDLTNFEINRLSLLATMHDIGKSNINKKILQKPDKLNKKEWEIMKKHSEQGYKTAAASEEYTLIADEILAHHERWDGTGYPQGLKGENIPYLARIISLVDAYDVMTNDRPYSKAISREEALAEIKACAGSQFDPKLAEEFIEMMNDENLSY
ncbi:MAG: diguanylate cyclase, partial [Halanaerobium sp.]